MPARLLHHGLKRVHGTLAARRILINLTMSIRPICMCFFVLKKSVLCVYARSSGRETSVAKGQVFTGSFAAVVAPSYMFGDVCRVSYYVLRPPRALAVCASRVLVPDAGASQCDVYLSCSLRRDGLCVLWFGRRPQLRKKREEALDCLNRIVCLGLYFFLFGIKPFRIESR